MSRKKVTIDGNEAVAHVAYRTNEVIAIYPITPSSNMGEWSDAWSSQDIKNIWGTTPKVVEMQSEGGASGAVHGALQSGSLTTTFTASQGLLLMIPNMYKIAGELTSAVIHVAARSIATHALSIFGDHSDVMAARTTGFAMVPSNSVQEAMDFALITQATTLEARVPIMHFFDGFRTSHEVQKIEQLSDDDLKAMMDEDLIIAHRERALNPDRPILRGTSQNPDVFFQSRETVNKYYEAVPDILQKQMDKFAKITGRQYKIFDYIGAADAERVIVIMGSGAEATEEVVHALTTQGEKVGVLKVRLFRPFNSKYLVDALPQSVKSIAVLDRSKEPGAVGEALYSDVVGALAEEDKLSGITVVGGRYGLSSKEFNGAMIKGIFDELKKDKPKNHFTVGIVDDVTHTSIDYDPSFSSEPEGVFRGMFYGLGADGTVGANKNSIKIIGEHTDFNAQGYFVYDSKKSGAITISHLRFGKDKVRSTYLINDAQFVGCHQFVFLETYDVLKNAAKGAVFLVNAPYHKEEVWDKFNKETQQAIIDKELKLYVIDAYEVAKDVGMGSRINTIMQTCFFAISGVLPRDEAIAAIKQAVKKTYGRKGEDVVQKNYEAIDSTLANLHQIDYSKQVTSSIEKPQVVSEKAPDFVKNVTSYMIAGKGDELPVSKLPCDGTYPVGTAMWEKRNLSLEVPAWDPELCIQCGKCALVCPHAVIRIKAYEKDLLKDAPATFKSMKAKGEYFTDDHAYTIQVAVEDCTGCTLCVEVCPTNKKTNRKSLEMVEQIPLRESESKNWDFFLSLPEADRTRIKVDSVKGSQYLQPLFEFSGACTGCGETPYIKLVTQLFGDRILIANATGCSSIYGGNLPTTPYTKNAEGRGPAWSNSLFEDTAEFSLGFRLTVEKKEEQVRSLLKEFASEVGEDLVQEILNSEQSNESEIKEQRDRVALVNRKIKASKNPHAKNFLSLSDYLVKKSVWSFGGDGWAYDIGYGGLDHILASGENINILVLDTEVYSNTGGQMSKSTPVGAVAKFAEGGKPAAKKDLSLQALAYGNVYVAKIAMGANETQTVKAIMEAEQYPGTSLIIAYSPCIAHGYDLQHSLSQQELAVQSGYWPMFRYNPALLGTDKPAFRLDYKGPKGLMRDYMYNENRFRMLEKMNPEDAKLYLQMAEEEAAEKYLYLSNFEQYIKTKVKEKVEA